MLMFVMLALAMQYVMTVSLKIVEVESQLPGDASEVVSIINATKGRQMNFNSCVLLLKTIPVNLWMKNSGGSWLLPVTHHICSNFRMPILLLLFLT